MEQQNNFPGWNDVRKQEMRKLAERSNELDRKIESLLDGKEEYDWRGETVMRRISDGKPFELTFNKNEYAPIPDELKNIKITKDVKANTDAPERRNS